MFREGLGETSEFSGFHPIVNLIYYVLAVGITMFSLSPWFLFVTLTAAWVYSLLLRGRKTIKINLIFTVFTLVVMAGINVFFTHDGETTLFYIGDNPITAEALLYGVSAAVMLISVIIWCVSFNAIMSADKLIFIFGKAAPVLGLTLSMVFRFIPLLRERFGEIRLGQKCMGRHKQKGLLNKVRQFTKEISILISWSLEASIESADSMEARGYGLKGRTSFHLYKFTKRDTLMTIAMVLLGGIVVTGSAMGKTTITFYPKYDIGAFDFMTLITLISYTLLLSLPIIIDIRGEVKWKQLSLEA